VGGRSSRFRPLAYPDLLARDAGPLITWGLTVTRGPNKVRQIWASIVSRLLRATKSSCAGFRIEAARSTS
jgi:3-polyprenyl-4-hydroxybenzoate decarboxylase